MQLNSARTEGATSTSSVFYAPHRVGRFNKRRLVSDNVVAVLEVRRGAAVADVELSAAAAAAAF